MPKVPDAVPLREPLFQAAIDDLAAAVRTTIDLAVRAASWVLLDDDDDPGTS